MENQPEWETANPVGNFFDWDWNELDIDISSVLTPLISEQRDQNLAAELTTLPRESISPVTLADQVQYPVRQLPVSIPETPVYNVRSLIRRPVIQTGRQRVANLTLQNLKAYPRMMLRHDALPPFVHLGLLCSKIGKHFMEPLNNCISLVHMISSGLQGSRKLFWKNVRLECEFFCEKACLHYHPFTERNREADRTSVSYVEQMGATSRYASPYYLYPY